MEITVDNHTLSPVVLFSVDSMSKRERREGGIVPGRPHTFYVPNSFYVPGMPSDTELRIKDYPDALATIYTVKANTRARPGVTQDFRWDEPGNPAHYLTLRISEAQTVTSDYSGLWTYRLFDPSVTWDRIPEIERGLIRADAVINFQTSPRMEWPDDVSGGVSGLDLNVTVHPGVGGEPASFDIVGTGRPRTPTDGWEYHYHGHLTRKWPHAVDQRPALVGSVIRVKDHNGGPGNWRSEAGTVYCFIAVKQQPPFTWEELSGSWAYRSFHNNSKQVYPIREDSRRPRQDTAEWPSPKRLILAKSVFKLESPTSTTLRGADEPLGTGILQAVTFWDLKGTVRPQDASFEIVGTGHTAGNEVLHQGHLTRKWSNGKDRPGDAAQALVGSFVRSEKDRSGMTPFCFHFIAVKQ